METSSLSSTMTDRAAVTRKDFRIQREREKSSSSWERSMKVEEDSQSTDIANKFRLRWCQPIVEVRSSIFRVIVRELGSSCSHPVAFLEEEVRLRSDSVSARDERGTLGPTVTDDNVTIRPRRSSCDCIIGVPVWYLLRPSLWPPK